MLIALRVPLFDQIKPNNLTSVQALLQGQLSLVCPTCGPAGEKGNDTLTDSYPFDKKEISATKNLLL